MITEEQILRQRRRPHRAGLKPKGELHRIRRERYASEQAAREQAASEQRKVNQVTTDVVIEPTESNFFEFEPDVYYDAIVDTISEVPNNFPDARSSTQLQWEFRVDSEQNEDGTVATKRGWSSPLWNPRAKTYKWALAILGAVDKDAPFRTSMLVGQPCRIVMVSGVDDKGVPGVSLNVVGPAKAKPAGKPKPGLVARLKDGDVPQGAVVTSDMDPCVLCGEPGTRFTGKGKSICEECA